MAQETQMLKGLLQGCILAILSAGEMYGYIIVESLKNYGFADINEATVYPILTRLEKQGLLRYDKRPSELGPPRKYYNITDAGLNELKLFRDCWNDISGKVNTIIKEIL
ncbi:MAG: PadR family transcriptional regulator [Clostridia bacterium]|nr:PadR family transcriptional regulator [Clostridia bacterium]